MQAPPDPERDPNYKGLMMVVGVSGEEVVKDFLTSHSKVKQPIEDLREDKDWQDKEVDFRIEYHNGEKRLIEVKSDRHIGKSHNVLFEVFRVNHKAAAENCVRLGWSVFSAADRFFVWCAPTQELYIFNSNNLRRAMQGYTFEKRKSTRLDWVDTDNARSTITILIPIAYVSYMLWKREDSAWKHVGSYKAEQGLHAQEMAA